ncbi:MAG TPA: hypothetical protein VM182_01310 [Terriglobia bacterium]|nr:hypothetical protein [Terriglobia bacterium]
MSALKLGVQSGVIDRIDVNVDRGEPAGAVLANGHDAESQLACEAKGVVIRGWGPI